MNAGKHTPGPWQYKDGSIVAGTGDGEHESVALILGLVRLEGEWEANARLIAAAPDLLQALEFCETVIRGDLTTQREGALRISRAAIAKATGEAA